MSYTNVLQFYPWPCVISLPAHHKWKLPYKLCYHIAFILSLILLKICYPTSHSDSVPWTQLLSLVISNYLFYDKSYAQSEQFHAFVCRPVASHSSIAPIRLHQSTLPQGSLITVVFSDMLVSVAESLWSWCTGNLLIKQVITIQNSDVSHLTVTRF